MPAALRLEAVLPIPTREVRMRTFERQFRGNGASGLVDKGAHAIRIVSVRDRFRDWVPLWRTIADMALERA